ncbi:MAG: HAMP domain-containing histidine kinase, partial [Psychrosphaera sp.]|nr:HAMP domain-containing histidine kinase [Psychrosphaera sp.]
MRILGKRAGSAQFSTTAANKRLIILLSIFATALLIPLGFLANHVYKQFSEEMYYEYRWNAEKVVKYTDKYIYRMMSKEEERPFGDYQFFKWVIDPITKKKEVTKSPLIYPSHIKHIPGYIGHFQIDADDKFSSPLLPYIEKKYMTEKAGMEWSEVSKRLKIQGKIKELLIKNDFLQLPKVKDPHKKWASNNAKDKKTDQKKSDYKEHKPRTEESYMSKEKEKGQWQPSKSSESFGDYTAFVVEIDPFQWKRSDDGYYFFYRKVWRKSKRYVQGFVVDEHDFLVEVIEPLFGERKFETDVTLQVKHSSDVLKEFVFVAGKDGCKDVLVNSENLKKNKDTNIAYSNLRPPLEDLSLSFSTKDLPSGPGSALVDTLLMVFSLVIGIGIFILYRAGTKQILLAEERLNFVSAVSHELKTPLTSILMYSEMLKEGMVSDSEKRKAYYDFIFFESERLSRLISNVLQLSRLGKDSQAMDIEKCSVNRLNDLVRSKTSTLMSKNHFTMDFKVDGIDESNMDVLVDQDAFAQVVINLVDNAIKFSTDKDNPQEVIRKLDVGFRPAVGKQDMVVFYIRDYGPGVDASQGKKIFDLFYRVGDELTRTKPGTGIGLALVSELANAMNGSVELVNRKPGAEFCVT